MKLLLISFPVTDSYYSPITLIQIENSALPHIIKGQVECVDFTVNTASITSVDNTGLVADRFMKTSI